MAHFPKSVDTLNAATQQGSLLVALAEKHGATNIQMASPRSVRFDIPDRQDALGNTINRVKLTAMDNGTIDVRLIQVIEHEVLSGLQPEAFAATLAATLKLEA
jgi:hypothetical protein